MRSRFHKVKCVTVDNNFIDSLRKWEIYPIAVVDLFPTLATGISSVKTIGLLSCIIMPAVVISKRIDVSDKKVKSSVCSEENIAYELFNLTQNQKFRLNPGYTVYDLLAASFQANVDTIQTGQYLLQSSKRISAVLLQHPKVDPLLISIERRDRKAIIKYMNDKRSSKIGVYIHRSNFTTTKALANLYDIIAKQTIYKIFLYNNLYFDNIRFSQINQAVSRLELF